MSAVQNSPETRATLLIKMRDSQDEQAWRQFVEIYAPLVHAYGRKRGLQDADAADLAQEVLQSVTTAVGSFDYDPNQGSFRGWLFTITLNKLRRMANKRKSQDQGSGETGMHELLHEQPADNFADADWNREHELRLFHWAAEQIRETVAEATWQAFWQTAVQNEPAAQVAQQLGLSTGAVYIAKSRVLARIREKICTVESD